MSQKKKICFAAFLCGLAISIAIPVYAASPAGSASDPFVAQSWVDAYVDGKFAPLEADVAAMRQAVEAALAEVSIVLTIGSAQAEVNGEQMAIDSDNALVVPYINNDGRTMVPARFVAESLHAEVEWNSADRTVTIVKGANTVVMTVGSSKYYLNGQAATMDTAPVIRAGWDRTVVPVRFVSEALGCAVDWEPKDGKPTAVYITK